MGGVQFPKIKRYVTLEWPPYEGLDGCQISIMRGLVGVKITGKSATYDMNLFSIYTQSKTTLIYYSLFFTSTIKCVA